MSLRWVKYTVIACIISVVIFVATLPFIISTEWGGQQLVNWVNRYIPGKLHVRSINMHWGHGQTFEGILLKDPEGRSVIGIEKFSTEATFWQLLNQKILYAELTKIQELNAAIITNERGENNLQQALGLKTISGNIHRNQSTIILSEVNVEFISPANMRQAVLLHASGKTNQDSIIGTFQLHVSLPDMHEFNIVALQQKAENYFATATINSQLVNFPVDLIDRLISIDHPHLNGICRAFLGEQLNLSIDTMPVNREVLINLNASSTLMNGELKAALVQGIINSKESTIFRFELDSNTVNQFMRGRIELHENAPLTITIHNFSFPLAFFIPHAHSNPNDLAFNIQAQIPTANLDLYHVDHIKMDSLNVLLSTAPLDDKIEWKAQVQANHDNNKQPFDVQLNGTIDKESNIFDFSKTQAKLESSLKLSNLPIQFFLTSPKYLYLIDSIGPQLNLSAHIKPKNKEWDLVISLDSQRLNLPPTSFKIKQGLLVADPFTIDWVMPNVFLQKILHKHNLLLATDIPIPLKIKNLQLNFNRALSYSLECESAIKQLELPQLFSFGKLQINNFHFAADTQDGTDINSKMNAQIMLLTHEGVPHPLMLHPLELIYASQWKYSSQPKSKIEMPRGILTMHTARGDSMEISAEYTADQRIILTRTAMLQYAITPQILHILNTLSEKPLPNIQIPALVTLTVEPNSSLQFNDSPLESIHAKGLLKIDHLMLTNGIKTLPSLEKITFPWIIDAPSNIFSINLYGAGHLDELQTKPSKLSARLMIKNWINLGGTYDFSAAIFDIQADLFGISVNTLSILAGQPDLSALVGSYVDVELKSLIDVSSKGSSFCDLGIDSTHFHLRTRLRYEEEVITLFNPPKPLEMRWTITPDGYNQLKPMLGMQDARILANTVILTGRVKTLHFPLKQQQDAQIDFHLLVEGLNWESQPYLDVALEANVNSENIFSNGLDLSLKISSNTDKYLSTIGKITDLSTVFFKGKYLDWNRIGLTANLKGILDAPFIQTIFPITTSSINKIDVLFGHRISVEANSNLQGWNGSLAAQVTGTQATCQCDGAVNAGVFTLKTPLIGEVKITPSLSQLLFTDTLPLFSSAISSEQPLQLKIEIDDFSCPIVPWHFENLRIGHAILNIGKIQFYNRGALRSFLESILYHGQEKVVIWFTPLYFQLIHSNLKFERIDMLIANTYRLASWGNINLNTRQSNIILALTAETLKSIFGIKLHKDDDLLQIPMQINKNGKMEIDKLKLAKYLSSMATTDQLKSKGKIFDYLIDIGAAISDKLPSEIATPPAPTTNPFPWDQDTTSLQKQKNDTNTQDVENVSVKKKKKKPFIGNILKQLSQ